MRIVIDLQGAQAENRNRGIGRYSLSLAKAMVINRGEHEVVIAVNGLLSESIDAIRAEFDELLPQTDIHVWVFPGPVGSLHTDNYWRRKTAELSREAFLVSLRPDVVLVTSLFEGLSVNAVTSIGVFSPAIQTAVILYDLIPLINRHLYLENQEVEAWYENKLDNLRRSSLILAISESSRQEGISHLGFPPEKVVNISTAANPQFQPRQIDKHEEEKIRKRYELHRPFVMYTGGIDHRKNIEGLIRAYSKLSKSLRSSHQLAIVCAIQPTNQVALERLANEYGLAADELVLTGFVPENDLVTLYNLCKVFIFPSWHEGFGLPALEAMSCGRAVIASNTSSLPEVIGLEDALFSPYDDESISNKLSQVLSNSDFRQKLEQHALKQAARFSWDATAKSVFCALENRIKSKKTMPLVIAEQVRRPKMAYISPLPPERSGISDYSAELLPELSRHYDIEVIVEQDIIADPWIRANCLLRSVEWFKNHSHDYERVLYHFGNSPFHQHMFDLLEQVPGCVVLHDFFLGHVTEYIGAMSGNGNIWPATLYSEHGYSPLHDRFKGEVSKIAWKYPCNRRVLSASRGVIVHAAHSIQLATHWYGNNAADDWKIIPLLRIPVLNNEQGTARRMLNLADDEFVVCSFGMLGPNKLNHRLLESWLASALSRDEKCTIVFVGENVSGDYGAKLLQTIANSGLQARIRITGWVDSVNFKYYLSAANIAVQLRTLSRGETSAAVLDCMNYGLATIVNINGSMADLSDEGVWKLPDEFENSQLINALETLWREPVRRDKLGMRAREIIRIQHAPRTCADQYAEAIEVMYRKSATDLFGLIPAIAKIEPAPVNANEWTDLVSDIALSISPKLPVCQLLVDISELVQRDSKTGIQRVVRNILRELLNNPPSGYRVEPIYATSNNGYSYARIFTLRFLDFPDCFLTDEPIDFHNGDIFLGLDLQHHVVLNNKEFYQKMRSHGVQVNFVVYDLLPILQPHCFGSDANVLHHKWLQVLADCDGVICISRAVASEMLQWLSVNSLSRHRPLNVGWFHLGADIDFSVSTNDMPNNAGAVLKAIAACRSFLMVGTIEPRKGQAQTLAAFEELWANGIDVILVIVGKPGWMVEELIETMRNHPERHRRLFWLDGISDEYLEKIYAASTCLIAASEGEGFGLPLIEAAQHRLPIIARDIPVFREVAGESAFYFSGTTPHALTEAVFKWLDLRETNQTPSSDAMGWLTWRQSTQKLLDIILGGQWHQQWTPDISHRFD